MKCKTLEHKLKRETERKKGEGERLRECKPSTVFVEDGLAMRLLVGGTVKPYGEGAIAVATVQRRRWRVAVFSLLAAPPVRSVRV